ncbi:uncharacterized protein LOC121770595 [Salvia splendens]|uniref:uncharacterized protein LOC121770595 n=1 Tax=Salvia splendens TaxID=180675 RepID=UPI001C27FF00|nr:uncharacterized protein LOC121770595 [Salvia splendens]XP_042023280.1 uncharacterized protein LOC121770595 [Salvia splendens]XP_042023281.1 uncharacterized protein LOC121770595 [Salvia splendens]
MANRIIKSIATLQQVEEMVQILQFDVIIAILLYLRRNRRSVRVSTLLSRAPFGRRNRIPAQVRHLNRLKGVSDIACFDNLRMDRNTFGRLCFLLRQTGELVDGKYVKIEEQVAMFLSVLAHHKKNRIVKFDFLRSGFTVSKYVNAVLRAVLRLHRSFLVVPDPVAEDCNDNRWKWFKGCLGALDGTHINLQVLNADKPRYRSRKGQICTNTLAVCDRRMRFVYVLTGWEGSAGDSRVLRDALSRDKGLRVPKGNYYLCDNGYANCEGFLTPYKGVRYHLKEWGPATEAPKNPHEIFNMYHTRARNVIERAFAVLKMRWGILRSASFYPVGVQTNIILACFLLHNFIRSEMESDPIEMAVAHEGEGNEEDVQDGDFVAGVEPSQVWTNARDAMAASMWDAYMGGAA